MRKGERLLVEYVTYDYDNSEEFLEHKQIMFKEGYYITSSYRIGKGLTATYRKDMMKNEGEN